MGSLQRNNYSSRASLPKHFDGVTMRMALILPGARPRMAQTIHCTQESTPSLRTHSGRWFAIFHSCWLVVGFQVGDAESNNRYAHT